jgi:hypothetical protein
LTLASRKERRWQCSRRVRDVLLVARYERVDELPSCLRDALPEGALFRERQAERERV